MKLENYFRRIQGRISQRMLGVLSLFILTFTAPVAGQNWGFEASPAASPPSNWTVVTGTWTINTTSTYVRTGTQSMKIVDPATTGTTIGTTNPFLTTTSAGYLITIGWGKSNTVSNALFYTGYRSGTTNTFNPSTTTSGQPANINNTTWSRVVSVSTSGTLAAGNYGIPIRAFRSASTTGTEVYLDDFIIYGSSSNVPDLSAPTAASGVTITGNNISWTNGIDNGAPASGIGGVVIIRTDGANIPAPTLNDQAMYATVNGAAGVGSFTAGANTWTVIASITGSGTTSFTDISAGSGPYTYVVYMRDLAYNYSPGAAGTAATPCVDPPTAGTPLAVPATPVCATSSVTLALSGGTGGIGQTFQWESSLTSGGSFTPVSGVLSSSAFVVNPTVTTYYRCVVTCGSGSSVSSEVQVTVNPAFPGGTYTINSLLPTGGTNFNSFQSAINALTACGIAGPIVFNVDPASGPYTEQISIPSLLGSSAVNTVTFNGNGRTLQFTPNTTNRHILQLNGADYITIRDLNIVGLAVDFDWGIHLINGADHDSIVNCTINLSANTNTTQSNSACIVASNSSSSVITVGNNANNLVVDGCTLIGGYSGVVLYGGGAGLQVVNNKIVDCIIRDFYSIGVELNSNNGSLVKGNDINRALRVTVGTFEGVELGANNINVVVDGNRIHDSHTSATTQSGTAYGIFSSACDATVGNENRIINNLIFRLNSGTGLIYGLYNSGSDGVYYYHNTVVLDNAASTAGTTRGFYQTTLASNIQVRNNIIYITRGGTGAKNCLYFGTTTSTISSNNNLLYMNSPAGTNGIGFFSTNQVTLANWQAVNSGIYDQQSISVDPIFLSPGTNDYTPSNPLADNKGVAVGVLTDLDGTTRDLSTPDVGAIEFTITAGVDVGAFSVVTPVSSQCYTNAEPVTIRIKNFGTDPIDFSVNPVTITCNITGPVNTTLTGSPAGILPIASTLDVVLSGTATMNVQGTYTFNVYTDMTGDVDQSNDTLTPVLFNTTVNAGVVSADVSSHCISGSSILTLSGNTPGTIQWQSSTAGISGPWTNVGTPASTYSTGVLTQTTYYRALVTCSGNVDSTDADTIEINNPQLLGTTPASRCGTGTVTLGATVSSGSTANWYLTPTGGTAVGTGTSFTTPMLSSTTDYYVAASDGGASYNLGLPNRVGSTTNSGYSDVGLMFDALQPFVLESVAIYPVATTPSGNVTATIALKNSAGTILQSITVSVPTSVGPGIKTLVPLNFNVPAGSQHRLVFTSASGGGISGFIREATTGFTYPYTLSGLASITSAYTGGASSAYYYYFYDWKIVTGCEGPRTLVTATVNPAPSISASSADPAICIGGSTSVSVGSSNDPNYEYTWTSIPAGFTAAGPGPHSISPTATTQYIVSAVDTSSGSFATCTDADTVTVVVVTFVDGGTVASSDASFCLSGTPTLSVTGSSGAIQWQESTVSTSGPWTNVGTGTIGYTPVAPITQTTYYRAVASCETIVDSSNVVTVTVNSPAVLTTTGDSNCGPGTLTLSATGTSTTLNWYAAPTGGIPLFTGSTFTTPFISATTTYYVAASDGGANVNTGLANAAPSATSGAGTTAFGLVFDALSSFTLQSVKIYPVAAAANTPGTVTIDVIDGSNTILHTATVNVLGNPGGSVGQTVTLNFLIAPGTNLKLRPGSRSASITGLLFGPAAGAPGGNYGYPFTIPGVLSITTSTLTAAPTNTPRPDLYYYFYDWVVVTGCESARTPVTATISAPPAITVSGLDAAVCAGGSTDISVVSGNDPNYVYTWTSNPAGFTASGNGPHTVTPSQTTTYIVSALDTSSGVTGGCLNIDSVTVVYTPALTPGTVSASTEVICVSGSPTITVTGSSGAIQWQESTISASGPWTNVGTGATVYAPGVLTQTTYYRILVSCQTSLDSSNVDSIIVNNPVLTGTTGDTRCGPGTLTLQATSNPGTNINWYANATGGSSLGTGGSFVTPFITSTTTYYAEASNGDVPATGGRLTNVAGSVLSASPRGIIFTATDAVNIDSVGFMCSGVASAVTVQLYNSGGTAPVGAPVVVNIPANSGTSTTPVLQTFYVNIPVPAAGTYRLFVTSVAPTGNVLWYEFSSVTGYPYAVGSKVSITSSVTALTGAASLTTYYYFYKLVVGSGCVNPNRIPVQATVTPEPPIDIAGTSTICIEDSTTLSITTGLSDYTTFTWFPTTGLSSSTGAVVKASPAVTTKYYVLATGNGGNCQAIDSITITVNDFNLSLSINNPMLCGATDSVQITTTATGGTFSYLWTPSAGLSSDTIANPKARPVGASQLYTLTVTNTLTGCTKIRSLTIYKSSPVITSTVADTVCGTDQVTLTANATPGTQVSWWTAASGGTRLALGSTFTPTISTTTKYYVEARDTIPQAPVSTGFGGGTIATDPNAAGNMFDITAINNIRITGFDVHLNDIDTLQPSNIAVYYKSGSYSGFTTNPAAWTLAGTATGVVSAGPGIATSLPLNLDIPINAGQTYGFYIVVTNLGVANSLVYSASALSPAEFAVAASDYNMQVKSGTVIFGPFTGQVAAPLNRLWNGNVKYSIGCISARDSVQAVSLSAPAITLTTSPNDTICTGSSVTLQASSANDPNYSYQWNPGALPGASVVVTPGAPTKYYVTATDTSGGATAGCVVVDSVTINLFTLPVIDATATPATVCAGTSVQLASNALGAQPQLDSLATGLTDDNGSSLVGFDIVNNSALPVTINHFSFRSTTTAGTTIPVTVMYSPTPLNCVIPTNFTPLPPGWVSLGVSNAVAAGAAPALTYVPLNLNVTIPPGATYAFALGTTSGSIRYKNGVAGCPNLISDGKITIKSGFGGALTGTTIGARDFAGRVSYTVPAVGSLTYAWTPAAGLSSATVANPVATPAVTTNYVVTVTNTDNGCSANDTVTVTVNAGPKPVIANNDTTLCAPNQIYVKVVDTATYAGGYPAGTTFAWYDATGGIIVPATPNLDSISSTNSSSFYAVVTLPNFCSATSDTAFVVTKAVAIVPTVNNATCSAGGSILATVTSGTAPFQYIWSTDPAQTNVIQTITTASATDLLANLAAGTYYLSVSDEFGLPGSCNSGVIPFTVGGASQIDITVDAQTNVTCNGQADGSVSISYTGGASPYSVLWSNGQTTTTLAGLLAGTYTVTVSDLSGCADTLQVVITEPLPISVTLSSTPESAPGANDGTATAAVSGGTPGYAIDWYDLLANYLTSGTTATGLTGGYYQTLVSDNNGCYEIDTVEVTTITNVTLNLSMLIEGMYDGAGGLVPALLNSGVGVSTTECDTIHVEVRDQVSPLTVLASGTAVLNTSGQASFTFPGSVNGATGYIVVFHRNAVQTWSDLVTFSSTTNYNFTTAATQAFGGNQIEVAPGVWAFYSGDIAPQDEVVDITDQGQVGNDIFNFVSGYSSTDVSGDGVVDITDQSIVDNNIFNFISSFHP